MFLQERCGKLGVPTQRALQRRTVGGGERHFRGCAWGPPRVPFAVYYYGSWGGKDRRTSFSHFNGKNVRGEVSGGVSEGIGEAPAVHL